MSRITVKELAEELQKLDQDLLVVISDYDGGDHCERFVTGLKVKNRNQVSFGYQGYVPGVKERFAHIVWQ